MQSTPSNDQQFVELMSAERDIARLITQYPYLLDSGMFGEVAYLLRHATLEVPGATVEGQAAIEQFLSSGIQRYADGTPRTWHAVSNILIDVDLENHSASSTSYFTVHQDAPELPLQSICAGHYRDSFIKDDGVWRFARRMVTAHLMGDVSGHVAGANTGAQA
jgi:hypothetical protein